MTRMELEIAASVEHMCGILPMEVVGNICTRYGMVLSEEAIGRIRENMIDAFQNSLVMEAELKHCYN